MSTKLGKMAVSLHELRTRAGLAQTRVAKKAGISGALLCLFEIGTRVPTPVQEAAIKAAISELSISPFNDPPASLTEYEHTVWMELAQICPQLPRMPSRNLCIRLVRLIAKMRQKGIGVGRNGKQGLTVPEMERMIYLFDTFRMTPASRGAVPWPESEPTTDARRQIANAGNRRDEDIA
jgi:hypothetical protein